MGSGQHFIFFIRFLQVFVVAAAAHPDDDFSNLNAVKANWRNIPPSWTGSDPCSWEGIKCSGQRITSMILSGIGLAGTLTADIGNFPELQYLDLSQNKNLTGTLPPAVGNLKNLLSLSLVACGFVGPIPATIGSLTQLTSLSLASNRFSGEIPPSIGNLVNLYLLDVTDNMLTGSIPVSNENSPGLDLLVNTLHFHLGQNQLTGEIPSKLFSPNMKLIHLLFDNNQLSGSIPSTIELVQSLELIRLDRNLLSGPVLMNFTGLTNMSQLYLSNNNLTGPIPDLSALRFLSYVDMSNNSFDASLVPPWFSNLRSLIILAMERTHLQGPIPASIFGVSPIQSVLLSNNHLNGTLDIGTNYGTQLEFVDLQNNSISEFVQGSGYNNKLRLEGNPICAETESLQSYCTNPQQQNSSYSTPPNSCVQYECSSNQISSPNCKCSYPITGSMNFTSFAFWNVGDSTCYVALQAAMMDAFQSHQLPVDSVAFSHPEINEKHYLELTLEVFPSDSNLFNRTGFSTITSLLSNRNFFEQPCFGPFHFSLANNMYFSGASKASNTGIIIGVSVGGCVLVLLLLVVGVYAFHQRRKAHRARYLLDPFASWDQNQNAGSRPNIEGVRCFSFEELKKSTNNFSDANVIGLGGYGKVYTGMLDDGLIVAVKRAQQGSLQGRPEFKTEIELLSRVHHKNLVNLVGFCHELGEQMLVYEYASNGTLKDGISGKSGINLSWPRRLSIALDSARGLAYLHELVNPPIIHRDVKSTNILLDDQLIAKVADFGLSKHLKSNEAHVSTQIRGTMGYMDPEYFMTLQLTHKSDVYSFGIVLLELITGRNPIHHGRHVVTAIRMEIDKTKALYNLQKTLDPAICLGNTPIGFEKFVDLAIRCVEDWGADRPTMGEVVKEIEHIVKLGAPDGNPEMLSSSTKRPEKQLFEYSGSFPVSEIELQ